MTAESLPTIAILGGTGKEGSGLALRWARNGYSVIIGSRTPEKAEQSAQELMEKVPGTKVLGTDNVSAARMADIVVLTVPYQSQLVTLKGVKEQLKGKILVDATARVDWRQPRPPEGQAAGRMAQELLGPEVRVVAAFQSIPSSVLNRLEAQPDSDVLVYGDDPQARAAVVKLAQDAGLEAYEAGGLDSGLLAEGLTAQFIWMNKRYQAKAGGVRVTGIVK